MQMWNPAFSWRGLPYLSINNDNNKLKRTSFSMIIVIPNSRTCCVQPSILVPMSLFASLGRRNLGSSNEGSCRGYGGWDKRKGHGDENPRKDKGKKMVGGRNGRKGGGEGAEQNTNYPQSLMFTILLAWKFRNETKPFCLDEPCNAK